MDYWKYSISSILVERDIEDEAVVSLFDNGHVWAIKPEQFLTFTSRITNQDWKTFLLVGITIACKNYGGICGNLLVDDNNVLDAISKGSDRRSIPTGMTPKILIFLISKKGVHGEILN
ncbi:PROF3 protein, partial [Locustella ochotensis]|nr:PROF3 protein [Locustella ochotensis]